MSKKKLRYTSDARTHRILDNKTFYGGNCSVCQKRSGSVYADCSPGGFRAKGYHGDGRYLYPYRARACRTWKYHRKTKWKV